MRALAFLSGIVAAASVLAGASCSSGQANDDAGAGDATTDALDNDGEPLLCQEFTEAGAACSTVSPVRCFPCGDAGGGCYCASTPAGPRWRCVVDPSCFPCTLGDENCAPDTTDDGGSAGADADDAGGGAVDGAGADASDAGSG